MCLTSSKENGFKGYTSPNCNFGWGFNNFGYQTNKHKCCQSNKQTKQISVHISFSFSIFSTTEEWASNHIWRYLWIFILFWALNSDFHEIPFSSSIMKTTKELKVDVIIAPSISLV